MKQARFPSAVAVASAALVAVSGSASAQSVGPTVSPTTVLSTPAAPAPTPPAPTPTAVAGHIQLIVQRAFGKPAFMIAGRRMVVRGIVVPYVAGQKVKVSLYRDGRKVEVRTMSVVAVGDGTGRFHLDYSSASAGLVQARAAHYATPAQSLFTGRSQSVRFVSTNLGPGAQGPSVWLLQSELNALHYVVPLDGSFDEATGRALIAYRKLTGLQLVPSTNVHVFELLQRGAGSFNVRYRSDGRHVEADLTRQVLAEIEPHGRVRAIYTMSSGKPSTPTVVGRFRVYSKTPGVNAEGMVDSNYFIRGYAIHGYPEVPTYAASHGCLRVPIPNAAAIYGWVQTGTAVDVYNERGGGSHKVRGNAGP
jgi:peptidoglycan hydrolase-like protein with peptidoglycan-binding domain